jgi:phytoene dehydrogenase-like protein
MSVDAVVIGAGPNGLAAAVELARSGASVLVREAKGTIGGGTRTEALTEPGYLHDLCSACHPMGILSPFFRSLPLAEHGLRWAQSGVSVAHPLDGEPAVLLTRSIEETAHGLGLDGPRYRRLVAPFVERAHDLLPDALAPLRFPRHPLLLARFGLTGLRSAAGLGAGFRGERARALLAGCAGHATQPLDNPLTAAMTLVFLIAGHVEDWPVAVGGSRAITDALASVLRAYGGRIETDARVTSLSSLPPCKVVLFDTSPDQLARLGAPYLPPRYVRRLGRYRYGPGSFKVDWALDGPIPWADPQVGEAATVHLGGTLAEIAAAEREVWDGGHPERPYVLVVQQSALDRSRAPPGRHTGYAYCHVPARSERDMTGAIEAQLERFAPGFTERIVARRTTSPAQFEAYSANYVGGAVTGGVADWAQLFTRPVARLDPYSTPNPRLFLCSASTPPGGGVHGMCGYHAARSALRRLPRLTAARFS